ncbi:MAG: DUF3820 family protein [Rhabdochlamydiaceae bacterium]|nr:DUF3820 family protein [Candidatus Amphrikana amoebophyrae]
MKRALYYDTETTGVKAERDRIIEIAVYDATHDKTYCSFVNPGVPIPEESTQITGITTEMVKDAPSWSEVGKAFFEFCGDDGVLIAHNNDNFDIHFLNEECKRSNMEMPHVETIDTLKWSRKYRPDLPRHSLQYLREVFGFEKNNAHRALDDVYMLHKIFTLMIGDLTVEQVMECMSQKISEEIFSMPFGKHKGKPLKKLPSNYLKWLAGSGALDKADNENLKDSLEKLGLLTNA